MSKGEIPDTTKIIVPEEDREARFSDRCGCKHSRADHLVDKQRATTVYAVSDCDIAGCVCMVFDRVKTNPNDADDVVELAKLKLQALWAKVPPAAREEWQ